VAACDYAILGEELYAVSAYLSREPQLLAQLKSTDLVKGIVIILILVGALTATFGSLFGGFDLGAWLVP